MLQRKQQPFRFSFCRHRAARLRLEALEDRLVLSTATSMPAATRLSVSSSAYSSTDILVQYQSDQGPFALPGTSVGQQLALVKNLYEINLSPGVSAAAAVAAYKAAPGVATAEPDYTLSVSDIPNSPAFAQQWSLRNTGQNGGTPGDDIGVTQAWNNTKGSSSIIVAVTDTGVDYTHPDLYQNIWINQAAIPASRLKNLVDVFHDGFLSMRDLNSPVNQGSGKITDLNGNGYIDAGDLLQPMILNAQGQDSGRGGWVNAKASDPADGLVGDLIGWNFSASNGNPYDNNGHGTHVAGIIGATGNGGSLGVDPNVQLMTIKFLDGNGHGSISQYIAGLNYAVSHGAKIINNSWTGADPSQMLIDAVANAHSHGVIFVAAAGNDGSNNDANPVYPSGFNQTLDNVVSVAATDRNNALAGFSNYGGSTVNLAAPGVEIYSTVPGGKYAYDSGTSMATPEVAGVMALVWSEHPNWSDTQVIHQVLTTVTKVSGLSGKVSTGGVLNAAAAVGAAAASSTPPRVINATASGPAANSFATIQLTFDQAIVPSSFTASNISLLAPGGRGITVAGVAVVAGTGNRTFTITFAKQTAPGAYSLAVGSLPKTQGGAHVTAYQKTFTIAAPHAPTVATGASSSSAANSLSTIQVTFNQGVDASTFLPSDVSLIAPGGKRVTVTSVASVAGTGNRTFIITFARQTAAGTYTLSIGTDAKDFFGNRITAYQKTFTIAAPPAPTLATGASSGSAANTLTTIKVTFNQGVDASTFLPSDVSLIAPGGKRVTVTTVAPVAGTGNRTFIITFARQTAAGTYTLSIGADAKDFFGNRITAYQKTFTIAAPPAPTVATGASSSGSAANTLSTIQVTFNQGVDASTFLPSDVSLLAPGGKRVAAGAVTPMAGTGNRTFTITFVKQTAPGTYTLSIGSDAKDFFGNRITAYQKTFTIAAPPAPTVVTGASSRGPAANSLSTIQVTFNQGVDASTFTPNRVGLLAPGGKGVAIAAVAPVAGTGNRTFVITFAKQTAPGNYSLAIGSDVKDFFGNRITAYQKTFTIAAPAVASFTSNTAVAIPSGGRGVSLLTIAGDTTIASLTVTVNIQYPRVGDLYIHLQAPDGTNIVLCNHAGGTNVNLLNTTFNDRASTSIDFTSGPLNNGSFQPQARLSPFAGKSLQGTWKLWVENQGSKVGVLQSWSLTVTPAAGK